MASERGTTRMWTRHFKQTMLKHRRKMERERALKIFKTKKTTMVKKWWSLGGYLNKNRKPLSRTKRSLLKGDWWVVMWIGFIRNLRCQIDTPIKWLLKIRVWADREKETHIPYHIQVKKSWESWKTHHQKADAWTENYGHDKKLKRHDRENHNKYPLRKTFPEEINQTNWILITEQTSRIRELGG